jgi:single-strand DNA-binding protein
MSGFTINVVVQSGNLTRDPELRALPSGTMVCELGVAVNDRYKDSNGEWQDRANFFDWTVWGGMGEWVANNCAKGDQVTLEGSARWR